MRRHHPCMALLVLAATAALVIGLATSAVANVTTYLTGALAVKQSRPAFDPGSITVKFRDTVSRARMDGAIAQQGCRLASRARFTPGLCTVAIPPNSTVAAMVAAFRQRLDVVYAEPTFFDYPMMVPNDPLYSQQWNFPMIHMEEGWDLEPGGAQTTIVAILDTGVAYENYTDGGGTYIVAPDLDGLNFVDPQDILDGDAHPNDVDAHGTHVCGTIAQQTNNSLGVAGMAFNISVMPVRSVPGTHQNFSDGVHWAVDHGAKIINYSAGGSDSQTKHDAVIYASSNNVLLIAAMGNDGERNPTAGYPGRYPECMGVGALNQSKALASYSNWGDDVDVTAPGGEQSAPNDPGGILQNTFEGSPTNMGYFFYQGTSMATPHVTGLAALLWSQGAFTNPTTDLRSEIETNCEDLGTPGWDDTFGWGLIDAEASLTAGAADLPPRPATTVNAFDTANDEGGSCTITWRRSPDDGAGRDDVVGYELWRGTQPDPATSAFVRVATRTDLPAGTSGYIDANPHANPQLDLVDGQSYYYFVRTFDKVNSVDSTVSAAASPRDDSSPPAIDNLLAQDTQADNGRSITLSWVGYTGSADLQRFRVYRSLAEFTSVTEDGVDMVAELTTPSVRNYVDKAKDPNADPTDPDAQPLDQTDYWYAVTALDEVGNAITTVTPTGPAQCAPNLSITFGYGLRMITVPAEPIDPSPTAVFGFTDPATASFARWDPLTQAYHTVSQTPADPYLTIVPGRAFWLNRDLPTFIGVGGRLLDDDEAEVALGQGWNEIGCPYDMEYPIEGIVVRDQFGTDTPITASNQVLVMKYGWRYDAFARSYRLLSATLPGAETVLPQREGMWIYAKQAGAKLVFYKNVTVPAEAAAASVAKLDGWQVRLTAQTDSAADVDNLIGVTSATRAVGRIVSPPPVSGGVDLYLTSGGPERLATDLRKTVGAAAKWNLVVECAEADANVGLAWPDLTPMPNDLRPVLKDLATGRSVYMRTAAGYTYRSRAAGEQRKFEITFGGPAFGPVLTQLSAAPANAGGVELAYTLARAADVTIEVRNLAGRLVATVAAPEGRVGLNRVLWNGQAAGGQSVPGGRYLICVTSVASDNGETARGVTPVTLAR